MTTAMTSDLRIHLVAKRLTMRDLANRTGYSYGHIRNICCGSQASKKARNKIEQALGMKPGSIWGDLETETINKENSDA